MSIQRNQIVALWNDYWFFRLNLTLCVIGLIYLLG
jgi:hypothetical protein